MPWVLIAVGGAAGAILRLGVATAFDFSPWATLMVNLIGSFAIGVLLPWVLRDAKRARFAPLVITGFLGGFTTFSAFAADTVLLLRDGVALLALGYVAITLAGGIAAALLGQRLMRQP